MLSGVWLRTGNCLSRPRGWSWRLYYDATTENENGAIYAGTGRTVQLQGDSESRGRTKEPSSFRPDDRTRAASGNVARHITPAW